jgi:hypothetical protein
LGVGLIGGELRGGCHDYDVAWRSGGIWG